MKIISKLLLSAVILAALSARAFATETHTFNINVNLIFAEVDTIRWDIGTIYQNCSTSTTGGNWKIVSLSAEPLSVYISVAGDGGWLPSQDGSNGEDIFVLRETDESGMVISTTPAIIANIGPGATYYLDLYYQDADENSVRGSARSLTVTVEPVPLAEGEWAIIDDDLVAVGTANGYLMWPRLQSCAATNNDATKQWKTTNDAGMPTWNNTTKRYEAPGGETIDQYPAFEWINNLNSGDGYKGYTDWRLPTGSGDNAVDPVHQIGPLSGGELKHLYEFGRQYIDAAAAFYWPSTVYSGSFAYRVSFLSGTVSDNFKSNSNRVRAVRSSQ